MPRESRDQRLARTKYAGQQSATERAKAAETASAPAAPGADAAAIYDQVRATPASAARRAAARTTGISKWRKETDDEWNR